MAVIFENVFLRAVKNTYLVGAILALCLFFIYNLNLRSPTSVDTLPNLLLPVSILKQGNLDLNEFDGLFQPQPPLWKAGFAFGALQYHNESIVSSYPVGTGVLASPFYALSRLVGILKPTEWDSYRLTAKLAASAIVALSVGILFLCLNQFVGLGPALWLSAAYGLGTGAFSIASQALWQHGPGMLCLSLALYAIIKMDRQEQSNAKLAFVAGLALAMAVACRHLNFLAAASLTLYMIFYQRKWLIPYMIAPVLIGIWLIQYNYFTFGKISGGYDAILGSQWHQSRNLLQTGLFNHPLLQGLLDTWLSPSKGLLIYSPFFIALLFVPFSTAARHQRLFLPLVLWVVLLSMVLAKDDLWWGGTSYGPRYFLEVSTGMMLLIAFAYPSLPKTLRFLTNGLVVIAILIHTSGAFYAPCGWAETPTYADFAPERHWDWGDMEIVRCAAQGLENGPLQAEFSLTQLF